MDQKPKCTRIVIEFEDGGKLVSENADHAEHVWSWILSCEVMSWVHGGKYEGQPLSRVEPPNKG